MNRCLDIGIKYLVSSIVYKKLKRIECHGYDGVLLFWLPNLAELGDQLHINGGPNTLQRLIRSFWRHQYGRAFMLVNTTCYTCSVPTTLSTTLFKKLSRSFVRTP